MRVRKEKVSMSRIKNYLRALMIINMQLEISLDDYKLTTADFWGAKKERNK